MAATGRAEQPEEFLDLCQKVKKMTEDDRKRKRTHEDSERPPRPALVYGPIDWRVQPKEKEMEKEEEKKEEIPEDAAQMEEMAVEAPKKKGKIKRRGKKKGKRNKPDREEKDSTTAMEC